MQIKPNKPAAYKLIHDGLVALAEASRQGMCIDMDYCQRTDKILTKKIKRLHTTFLKSQIGRKWQKYHTNVNINSDQQLSFVLHGVKKLQPKKNKYDKKEKPVYKYEGGMGIPVKQTTASGSPSLNNESIELLIPQYPELKDFVEYKKLTKVQGTYIQKFIKETVNGVMRPTFSLHKVVTYRSSSQDPNFQNIPNRDAQLRALTRRAFLPRPGHQLMAADFSGIEVAISCCNHLDPKMIKYVSFPEKNNMHSDMAIQLYMLDQFKKAGSEKLLRKGAKNGFVFPQFYGDYYGNNAPTLASWGKLPIQGNFTKKDGLPLMTGITLGEHLINNKVNSFDDFVDHIHDVQDDFWDNRFKVYNNWKIQNVKEYFKKGYLNMLTGFTCSGFIGKNDINNYPVQGPAFHCLLKTFIKLNQEIKERKLKSRLIGQIHDEVVLDAHPSEIPTLMSLIKWIACEWLLDEWKWIIVPMEIETSLHEVNANWASASESAKLRKTT